MKLLEYMIQTLPHLRETVKPSTYALYEYRIHALEHYIIDSDIETFDTKCLQRLADAMSQKFSRNTVLDNLVFIRMFLRRAMTDEIIPEKHFGKVRVKAAHRPKKHQVLSDEEFSALSAFCIDNIMQRGAICCLLGMYAGLRIGEIAALKWEDVDFPQNKIYINRTRYRIYSYGRKDNPTKIIDGSPKSTTSIREIPMSGKLKKAMNFLRNENPRAVYVASNLPNGTEPRQIREYMRKIVLHSGIPEINPHGLRHSFISKAINNGASIKAVSELAGHANAKITLEIYTHANEKSKIAAIAALEL